MKLAKMKYLMLLTMALSLLALSIPAAGVYAAAAPVVTAINPHIGMKGTVLNNATISGTDLNGATSIFFSDSGVSAAIISSTSTQILVNINVSTLAQVGSVDVHVTTSGGGEGFDTFNAFTVISNQPPTVTSLSRLAGAQGAIIKGVIITGTHLLGATNVTFSTADVTGSDVVPIDDNSISATINITAGAPLGARNVTVITPAGSGTKNGAFTVVAPQPPTITSISPGFANNTGVKEPMLITGTDFEGVLSVNASGSGITITDVNNPGAVSDFSIFDDTRIILNYSVDAAAAPGPRDITVITPYGTSNARVFTVYNATVSVNTPGGVTAGDNFFVYINVGTVSKLNSSQFDLTYNPSRIEVVGAEAGPGVSNGIIGGQTYSMASWGFIPVGTPGLMRVESHNSGINSVTGSGYLARIQFHYKGTAGTSTSLNLPPMDSLEPNVILGVILASADGPNLPATTKNGLIVANGLAINSLTLPEATAGKTYPATAGTTTATASGGTGPYSWSATGLPIGLSINQSSGAITGTPSAAGDFTVSLTVTDSASPTPNTSTMGGIDLYVWPALSITTSVLPDATIGNAYFKPVAATGGKPQYTWSATGLPGGLAIGPGTGIISGTPTQSGNFSAAITVGDSFSPQNTSISNLALKVNAAVQITNSVSVLPPGNKDSVYTPFTVTATGGTGSYTWSATGLPGGLSIGPGSGIISGTPTVAGDFNNVVVTVTDAASATANKTFTLHINGPLAINTSVLNDAVAGIAYSFNLTAGGGTPSYSWSITVGSLPLNLTMDSSGHISGTPAAAGDSTFTVKVTDSVNASVSLQFTLHVYPPLQITPASLPDATAGQAYSVSLNATGGNTHYTWTVTGLPGGLTFNSTTPAISGTPAAAGTPTITITVRDSANPQNTATISPILHIYTALQVTPAFLPDAMVGTLFSVTLNATGGKPLYAWSATGLPGTLTLTPSADTLTANLSGTPSTAVTGIAITLTVTDSASPPITVTAHLTLNIYPTLVINTASLPRWAVETGSLLPAAPGWILSVPGTPYAGVTFSATGGKPGYSWSAANLPPGLTIDPVTGLFSGTPTSSGQFDIVFRVTDSANLPKFVSKTLSLKIYKQGDANGDDVVTVLDITYAERVILGLNAPTAGSDANLSGTISIGDIAKIEKLIIPSN